MKVIKEVIPYIVIVVVVVLIRTFIITPVRVDGDSMKNTLKKLRKQANLTQLKASNLFHVSLRT